MATTSTRFSFSDLATSRLRKGVASFEKDPKKVKTQLWKSLKNLFNDRLMPLIIFVSVGALIMESSGDNSPAQILMYEQANTIFSIFFTIEFSTRVTANLRKSKRHKWGNKKFLFYLGIDLAAITPFLITLIISSGLVQFNQESVEFLSLAKIFRLFKLSRHYSGTLILEKALKASVKPVALSLFYILNCVIILSTILYFVDDQFSSIPHAIWFACVTMTTVGYGDIYPRTLAGRNVAGIMMLTGIIFLGMPLSIVGQNFVTVWTSKDKILLVEKLQDKFADKGINSKLMMQAFQSFDNDNSGSINLGEFSVGLSSLGIDLSKKELWTMWNEIEHAADGTINYHQFSSFIFQYGTDDQQAGADETFGNMGEEKAEGTEANLQQLEIRRVGHAVRDALVSNSPASDEDDTTTISKHSLIDTFNKMGHKKDEANCSFGEMVDWFRELGVESSYAQLMTFWNLLDDDHSGSIDVHEFSSKLHELLSSLPDAPEAQESPRAAIERSVSKGASDFPAQTITAAMEVLDDTSRQLRQVQASWERELNEMHAAQDTLMTQVVSHQKLLKKISKSMKKGQALAQPAMGSGQVPMATPTALIQPSTITTALQS